MTAPPLPLTPSGLAAHTRSFLGRSLIIRCCSGWGWSVERGGQTESFEDSRLTSADIEIIPDGFVSFRNERGGIYGSVVQCPVGFHYARFLAFTMSDGTEYDFTDEIAQWRVIFADGDPDYDSHWFPLLNGNPRYLGYGAIALSREHHDTRISRTH